MKKQNYILVVLIVILIGYLFLRNKEKINYKLPVLKSIEKTDVHKLEIKKSGKIIAFSRVKDNWIIEPEKYEADNKVIDELLNIIVNLKITDLASQAKSYNKFQLGESNKIEVKLYSKDAVIREFEIGKTSSSYKHTFVKLPKDINVYYASGNFKSKFDKPKKDYREKTVLKFDEEILSIDLTDNKKQITVKRAGFDKGNNKVNTTLKSKWVDSSGNELKTDVVERLISTCRDLKCNDFLKEYQISEKPIYTIKLKGSKNYSLNIYDKTKDDLFIVTSSENKYTFLLEKYKAEQLMVKFKELYHEKK